MGGLAVESHVMVAAMCRQHPITRIGERWVEDFKHATAKRGKHHVGRGKPIKSTTHFGWEEAKAIQLLQN